MKRTKYRCLYCNAGMFYALKYGKFRKLKCGYCGRKHYSRRTLKKYLKARVCSNCQWWTRKWPNSCKNIEKYMLSDGFCSFFHRGEEVDKDGKKML